MFSKPLSQIIYSDVEQFCSIFSEGVRVEYKSEMIENIPKVVSAFANTLGGIVVIGVEADKVSNKVVSIKGICREEGMEERIINASLNGIYPAVIPEIRILDVPDKKDRIVVVIKVHESVEAPHSIQNSTRVYIRTASVNQPHELAEVDRIEYLLKRRSETESRREALIEHASNRLKRNLKVASINNPILQVSIAPVFPYQPLITLEALRDFCNGVGYGSPSGYRLLDFQMVNDGVCKFGGSQNDFSSIEVNQYGLIFVSESLGKSKAGRISSSQEENEKLYLRFLQFVITASRAIKLAGSFYKKCGYLGNLEVEFVLENIAQECLLFNEQVLDFGDSKSIDNGSSSSVQLVTEEIDRNLVGVVTSLLRKILWVFNCPVEDASPLVERILIANNLIPKKA